MRLQFGVTSGLIAIAVALLLLTGEGTDRGVAQIGKGPPPQPAPTESGNPIPTATAAPVPARPTISPQPTRPSPAPWLRPPEWVAVASADELPNFGPAIVDIDSGRIWSFAALGAALIGQPSDVSIRFLGWTPENEALVRVSGGGRATIYVALLGKAFVPWAVATGSGDVRYSPDGLLVAVDHTIYDPSSGLAVVELPPGEFIGWSADSRYFAVGGDPDDQVPRVLAWDRETGRFEEATLAVTGIWSSTGHRIAYGLDRNDATETGLNEILIVEFPDNPGITPLARIRGVSARPLAWSYDDAYLAVTVTQPSSGDPTIGNRVADIHIVDMHSGETVVVIGGAWQAAWSPTTDLLLFTGNVCSSFDIFTLRSDGTGLRNYTSSPDTDLNPLWAPNGEVAAFVSFGEDAVRLNLATIRDGSVETLFSARPDEMHPLSWSPDGRFLEFRYGGGHGLCKLRMPQDTEVKVLG